MATALLASPDSTRRRVHFCSNDTCSQQRSCSSLGSGPLSRPLQTPMTPAWLTPAQAARAHSAYGAPCGALSSDSSSDGTPLSDCSIPWEFMLHEAHPRRESRSPPEMREAANVLMREVAALILQTWVRRHRARREEQLQLRQVARQLWRTDCAVRRLAVFHDPQQQRPPQPPPPPDWRTVAVHPHRRRRALSLENLKAATLDQAPSARPPNASNSSAARSTSGSVSSARRPLASLRPDNGQLRPRPTYRQLKELKRT